LRSRQAVATPTQPSLDVPAQLDRADFPQATAPWMVAVFSSASCNSCADVLRKAQVMASSEVSVVDVEFTEHRALHHKYGIEAVPLVAIADAQGVVRRGFAGPVTATDLWAAVAEARER
jgi:thioredoxin-like negative regulator of GroEL